MTAGGRGTVGRIAIACLTVGLAFMWVAAGLGTISELMQPDRAGQTTWAAQFPIAVLAGVGLSEVAVGLTMLLGSMRVGAIGGLILLAIFTVAMSLWPPRAAQECGCGGALGAVLGNELMDPGARNFLLAGVHVMALALTWPAPSRKVAATPVDGLTARG